MEDDTDRECLFCRCTIIDPNFVVVDDFTIEILNIVIPKLGEDLDDSKEHLICNVCYWKLSTAFNFKSTCLTTDDILYPYLKKEAPVDLRKIYMKEKRIIISDDQKICRLCMECIDKEFVFAKELDVDFFQKCISEMNLAATLDPVVCNKCVSNLIVTSSFIKRCFSTEEKVTNFYKQKVIGSRPDVSSSDKSVSIDEEQDDSKDADTVKIESNSFKSNEAQKESAMIKTEEVEIKDEDTADSIPSINCPVGLHETENLGGVELPLNAEIRINSRKISSTLDLDNSYNWYECNICDHKCERKANLKRHMLVHKCPSEIQWYECDICGHRTKHKAALKLHMLVHKDPSEIQWYVCDICDYRTRHKSLKSHMLVHKHPSEIQGYGCDICGQRVKYEVSLKKHMLMHKDSSEIQWHGCDICGHRTKHKSTLKSHMLVHKDPSEIQWYVCDICDYRTKHKSYLKTHMLVHTDSSKIQWYHCDICGYKTKYKSSLKIHMLMHKDASEIQWYVCDVCNNYKSKQKSYLRKHMLTHKDASEIQWYKCDVCVYKTKHKGNLKKHMSKHKNTSERTEHSSERQPYGEIISANTKQA